MIDKDLGGRIEVVIYIKEGLIYRLEYIFYSISFRVISI